ncbi:MAG: chromate efflux transporter [Lacipirellulaceae bacterium]
MVPWREFLGAWGRVAALSFGGPAGQIAVMHRTLVDERRWISEDRFLHALNYCMLLPGPEAQQLAVYLGWLQRGLAGGLVAGCLFVLPGFLSILALSFLYAQYRQLPAVEGLLLGLQAAVLALVVDAAIRVGKRALRTPAFRWIAGLSFVAIAILKAPFPLIVLVAAIVGWLGARAWPAMFKAGAGHGKGTGGEVAIEEVYALREVARPPLARSLATLLLGLALWLGPVAWAWNVLGSENVYTQQGVFFSKAAVVTFGGAYAVLGYIAQQAVERFEWLTPSEMLDGLAMAETTPGPLIQVVQFVGFLAAYRNPGPLSPLAAGVVGSVVTTWVTFAPCFLWIFLGGPHIERLRGNAQLAAVLAAITAAVVGVMASLAIWFAAHTLFAETSAGSLGPLAWELPTLSSVKWLPLGLSISALFAIRGLGVGAIRVLLAVAGVGVVYGLVALA